MSDYLRMGTPTNKRGDSMKVSEVLIKAKEIISNPENWYKGDWSNPDKPDCYCSLGAIGTALNINVTNSHEMSGSEIFPIHQHRATKLLESVICDNTLFGSIANFNDSKDTTHEYVMTQFDKAIEIAMILE